MATPRKPGKPGRGGVPPVEYRFKKGKSGNPAGRPKAGASIREWWNALQDATLTQLKAIAESDKSPTTKAIAAVEMIHARSLDRSTSGMPINGPAVDRIIEHTDGKAKQSVEVSGKLETGKAESLTDEQLALIAAGGGNRTAKASAGA